MQKSGFFNALNVNGEYDRKYNANDYSDNLAVVISNGVLRSRNDDLKVTSSGMVCSVAVGRAWINGHYYYNDTVHSFAAVSAPTGGTRYDRIMLRLNTNLSVRSISLVYVQGTAANTPTKPAPVRTGGIYDLVIADIFVGTNATSVTVTDTRSDASLCGWVYSTSGDDSFFTSLDNSFNEWFDDAKDTLSSVTLFKRYQWRYVLIAASKTVQFVIPQYDADTCFIEVYINGILDHEGTDYTVSGNTLTFVRNLIAGTEVIVNCYKSIDGTGIESVADEITELQNQVASIISVAEMNYDCTGLNDNISLSQIAQAIYAGSYTAANVTPAAASWLEAAGGNTWLASLTSDAHITINVVGNLAASTPFSGSGSSTSRYKWFALGVDAVGEKRITFDFAKCGRIYITPAGSTENIIFFGTDLDIRNVYCFARCNAANCAIEMFAGRYNYGNINVENARLKITTTGKAIIAENGTFTNCWVYNSSSDNHALAFCPTTDSLIRVFGGTFYCYVASTQNKACVFYVYTTEANAVILAQNVNCPTKAVSAFYQNEFCVSYTGNTIINGVITTLPTAGTPTIQNRIQKNKPI